MTRVVLASAHLDHDPSNNHPHNLSALCQRCHLSHDRLAAHTVSGCVVLGWIRKTAGCRIALYRSPVEIWIAIEDDPSITVYKDLWCLP